MKLIHNFRAAGWVTKLKVLLTADRPLMSNYHNKEFFGFGTASPPNVVPEWFFKLLFFPLIKTKMKATINYLEGILSA